MYRRTAKVTEEVEEGLQTITEEHPEYNLDEIADALLNATGKYLSVSTLYRALIENHNIFCVFAMSLHCKETKNTGVYIDKRWISL